MTQFGDGVPSFIGGILENIEAALGDHRQESKGGYFYGFHLLSFID